MIDLYMDLMFDPVVAGFVLFGLFFLLLKPLIYQRLQRRFACFLVRRETVNCETLKTGK